MQKEQTKTTRRANEQPVQKTQERQQKVLGKIKSEKERERFLQKETEKKIQTEGTVIIPRDFP